MRSALDVFQKINPIMVFLYGRKPSFIRAAIITVLVVASYSAVAWYGDALFLKVATGTENDDMPVLGLAEDYTHHVLVFCGLVVLFGGKQFQMFLANTPLADLQHGKEAGISFNPKYVAYIWWACFAVCAFMYVFGQFYTPWFTEAEIVASWATLPRLTFIGWLAGCITSLYFFFAVLSVALWLITSCVFVVVPRLAQAIRNDQIRLNPLHPDGMGGQGALMSFALAVMLTYVSVAAYVIAFGVAFKISAIFISVTAVYILLLPFIATAPFIRINRALREAKDAKLLEYSQLYQRKLQAVEDPSATTRQSALSLTDIDAVHKRYASISTWPLSIRSAAVPFSLVIPILANLPDFVTTGDGTSLLEMFRLFLGLDT